MPNYCENIIAISGKDPTLDLIINRHFPNFQSGAVSIENYLDFNTIRETPSIDVEFETMRQQGLPLDEIRYNLIRRHSVDDEDTWRDTFWGCSSLPIHDMYYNFVRLDEIIIVNFFTRWAPPTEVMRTLSVIYPEVIVDVKYIELGVGFGGDYKLRNGHVISGIEEITDLDELKRLGLGAFEFNPKMFDTPSES